MSNDPTKDEIEDRKARVRALKDEHAKINGGSPGGDVFVPREALDAAVPPGPIVKQGPSQRRLLELIEEAGYAPGDFVSPRWFHKALNVTEARSHQMARALKEKGLWPYSDVRKPRETAIEQVKESTDSCQGADDPLDKELVAMKSAVAIIRGLPNRPSRNRVLAYLYSRITEEP